VSDAVRNAVRSPAVRGVERGVVGAGEGFSGHPGGAQVLGVGGAAPVALLFLGAPSPAVLKENALQDGEADVGLPKAVGLDFEELLREGGCFSLVQPTSLGFSFWGLARKQTLKETGSRRR
jgi:hypothetical protein